MAMFVKIAIANGGAVSIAFNFKHCFEQKRKKKNLNHTSMHAIAQKVSKIPNTGNIRRIPINLCIIFLFPS